MIQEGFPFITQINFKKLKVKNLPLKILETIMDGHPE
jgi:hypothetical protein